MPNATAFGIKISSNFGAVEVQFITLTLMNCSLHTMTTLSLTLAGVGDGVVVFPKFESTPLPGYYSQLLSLDCFC